MKQLCDLVTTVVYAAGDIRLLFCGCLLQGSAKADYPSSVDRHGTVLKASQRHSPTH